ncbi:hypothetical protein ACXIUH_08840 [Vibrio parahaemolyticus]
MTFDAVESLFRQKGLAPVVGVAKVLGITHGAVAQWKRKKGGLIPELQARKLAEKYPELKFDASAYQSH